MATPLFSESPHQKEWIEIRKSMKNDLPKTAIEQLNALEGKATAKQSWAELAKIIAIRCGLQGEIDGGSGQILKLMDTELEKAPDAVQPLLQTIQAHWFYRYFQGHRWVFAERSATAQEPSDDIETWDMTRVLAEVDKRFQIALADSAALQKQPISKFTDILTKAALGDTARPTLYDFLVHQALSFYCEDETAASRPQDAFRIHIDDPAFGSAEEFLAWKPETDDTTAPSYRALTLFQELLSFHQNDADPTAFLNADLARLRWANRIATGTDSKKDAKFEAALRAFIEKNASSPLSADARHDLVELLDSQEKFTEAHKIAKTGADAFPDHVFGQRLANFIFNLETPRLLTITESTWTPAGAKISVEHRNLKHIYFRAYKQSEDFSIMNPGKPDVPQSEHDIAAILTKKADFSWDALLPDKGDFQKTHTWLDAPRELEPGYYWILAGTSEDFSTEKDQISAIPVRVTTLAMLFDNNHPHNGLVTDALSGNPIENAKVTLVLKNYKDSSFQRETTQTDKNGQFSFTLQEMQGNALLIAEYEGSSVVLTERIYSHRQSSQDTTKDALVFFTDRSIYRPGQTIHFSGIWCRTDLKKADYQTVPDATAKIILRDPNGKEIESLELTTNANGTLHGSFTAPGSSVLGSFTIAGPHGETRISVEEYKRPKFAVKILPPKQEVTLGEQVTIIAEAKAYTGAAVDSAKVSWRVRREVDWPFWVHPWMRNIRGNSTQEIAHGEGVTTADGTCAISFDALPDESADPKNDPIFRYYIAVDITDAAGETRHDSWSFPLAYTGFAANLTIPEWIENEEKFSLVVRTHTHSGQPISATGILSIYQLSPPSECLRQSPIGSQRHPFPPTSPSPNNPDNWPLGELLTESTLTTAAEGDDKGKASVELKLPGGYYRAIFTAKDKNGNELKSLHGLRVLDTQAKKHTAPVPFLVTTPKDTLEPGDTATLLWGSGFPEARALVTWLHGNTVLESQWSEPGRTQQVFTRKITEQDRGDLSVLVTQLSQNLLNQNAQTFSVPWTKHSLTLRWEHFTDKLEPGAKETWTAVVTDSEGKAAPSEMVATLYDASLDAFSNHSFPTFYSHFLTRQHPWRKLGNFSNTTSPLQDYYHWSGQNPYQKPYHPLYREFNLEFTPRFRAMALYSRGLVLDSAPTPMMADSDPFVDTTSSKLENSPLNESDPIAGEALEKEGENTQTLDQVSPRENLNETAFFFPTLTSNEEGEIRMSFTMPEALTEWQFFGFAHDKNMRSGSLNDTAVTAKDLMVQPNPPRFLREGDEIDFPVRITNLSDQEQVGTARLSFADAATLEDVGARLGIDVSEQEFTVPARESRTLTWKLKVPEGVCILQYKAVAVTDTLSDGEQAYLPVISRRILINESLSLPIRDAGEKHFTFDKLKDSADSDTLQTQTFEVQAVSQPAWYGVLSLPYLMEFPHQCSEQIFHRYYANSIARHIANSDPKIRRIFELWKGTEALDSPLHRNQDIKNILIEETPWLRYANDDSAARQRIGLLFDDNKMDAELTKALDQLSDMQHNDGLFPWFEGGPSNTYITLNIATGFARLRALGVETDITFAINTLPALDANINKLYRDVIKLKDTDFPDPFIAHYLYTRTLFLNDVQVKPEHREAFDFFVGQAERFWTSLRHRQSRAHIALALHRLKKTETAKLITQSLRENAVNSEELGMRWNDAPGWFWYQSPIETQAMMIEAFREIDADEQAVEDCQVWLIKQRQVNDWRTTTATADAVYALLLGGKNLLDSDELLQLTLGDRAIQPETIEAGTGFYQVQIPPSEVNSKLAEITVKKSDPGVAWASVHWQYLEDIAKITPHEATPLKLEKQLYLKKDTKSGKQLIALEGQTLQPGDELVTRLVLRNDRPMEFLHLKDYRGSGTEPVDVLSGYHWQGELGYYRVTRDTATHLFIDSLPAGTHVIETSVRIQHRGRYQTGIAEIQSMYAPEFGSHSASLPIHVE